MASDNASNPVNPSLEELEARWEQVGLRAGLEKAIGGKLSDEAWRALIASERDYLSRYTGTQDEPIADLSDLARRQAEAFPVGARRLPRVRREIVPESPPALDPRWRAVGEILALEAAERADVREWRERHLPDGLVGPSGVEPLLVELLACDVRESSRAGGVVSFDETLDYRSTEDELRSWIGVGVAGPLHDLRLIARRLAIAYHCSEGDAATFVLTGWPPTFAAIKVRLLVDERAATSRVLIDADPRVSPSLIAEMFETARRHDAFAEMDIGQRLRRTHEKVAELAIFLARGDGGSWRGRRKRWNATAPAEWQYGSEREFARDAQRAWFAVMGERLPEAPPPRKENENDG
ncbi:MAG: hypothetical protein ABSC51_01510 [Gaiellaceae bacterium]|jgi:hypothetical protein